MVKKQDAPKPKSKRQKVAQPKSKMEQNTTTVKRHPIVDTGTIKDKRYGQEKKIGHVMTKGLSEVGDEKRKQILPSKLKKNVHRPLGED